MKKYLPFLVLNILMAEVPITTHFERGQEIARAYDRPMVLIFTGSDWSDESQKLVSELRASEFCESYILVQVDFPEHGVQENIERAFALKEEFAIEAFPTAVLLTPLGEEVTRFGRLTTPYPEYLRESLAAFEELEAADLVNASDKELMRYYDQATRLGNHAYMRAIVDVAVEQKRCAELLIDRFCQTGDAALKETIITLDPDSDRMHRLRERETIK